MTKVADSLLGGLLRQAKADLLPFPGRFDMAWRVAALCALMAWLAMLYGIPESALSCYLIIFIMKPDAAESMVMAIGVTVLLSLVVGVVFLLIQFSLENAPLRMTVLTLCSFLFVYLGSATKLGEVGNIIALVIAFVMTLLSNVPSGELITRGILYAWLMAVSPMMLIVGFNLIIGRAPHRLLRASVSERLFTVAEALRQPDCANMDRVRLLLNEGQAEHQQRALLVRMLHLRPAAEAVWLDDAVNGSYRLLLVVSALPAATPEAVRHELAACCTEMAQSVAAGDEVIAPQFSIQSDGVEVGEIKNALLAIAHLTDQPESNAPKMSFFAADALSNPVHVQYALKTTAAALICYLVYTALNWQDIHTAMITCYVAALGTAGETVHKLLLRIVGCLIGAALGVLSILFIIPYTVGIGELMVLVFAGTLAAAWVSCGNERISYAGVQIGLAFLLTVLQGFKPSLDMGVALDRVIGILLGNLVVYLIFTRLWPVAIVKSVRVRLGKALSGLVNLATLPSSERRAALREATEVEAEIASAQNELALVPFEPQQLRPTLDEQARLKAVLMEMAQLSPPLYMATEKSPSDIARLRRLSEGESATSEKDAEDGRLRQEPTSAEMTIQQRIKRLEGLLGA